MNAPEKTTGVVLAVDDTAGNLRVLLESLSAAGHEVLVATDGQSALETARYARPDLILLDVMMPGMDGYRACEALKKDEATAGIPVIFMTALTETDEKVKGFQLGAVDFVTKPFEEAELLARVHTHLTIGRLRLDAERRNRQLEELNQLKNEFLGMAAHDIRNPLSSAMACADLIESLADCAPPEKTRRLAGQISSAARRINAIITNLLDVNAIDSGQRRVTIATHDLSAIAARVVQQNAMKADVKEIRIHMEQGPGPVCAATDESSAEQVLDNIISNAVKYSPPGHNVTVRVLRGSTSARVEVIDKGPGLSAEDQARMFGKFCRLSAKPTAGEASTGLGLWIVKQLVDATRGSIRCESVVGSGSTFIVEWPLGAMADLDCTPAA